MYHRQLCGPATWPNHFWVSVRRLSHQEVNSGPRLSGFKTTCFVSFSIDNNWAVGFLWSRFIVKVFLGERHCRPFVWYPIVLPGFVSRQNAGNFYAISSKHGLHGKSNLLWTPHVLFKHLAQDTSNTKMVCQCWKRQSPGSQSCVGHMPQGNIWEIKLL